MDEQMGRKKPSRLKNLYFLIDVSNDLETVSERRDGGVPRPLKTAIAGNEEFMQAVTKVVNYGLIAK